MIADGTPIAASVRKQRDVTMTYGREKKEKD